MDREFTSQKTRLENCKRTTSEHNINSFFQLCQTDPFAKTLLYVDVPIYYTWDKTRKIFQRRKQGMPEEGHPEIMKTNAIGRVYTVHPNNAECFYLRMLLHEIRGPTNFTDLRTIDGYICHTYREACQRLGLLENDNHWELTLQEATLTASAEQIRELFAIILTTCNPSNPKQLWDSFKRNMSDDILYQIRQANPELTIEFNDDIFNETLIRLEDKCLAINNQTLVEIGMPAPQRNTFRGTGKTFLINLILAEIRAEKHIALALASSGIAATLMEGGRTAHSALQLPLNIAEQQFPVCKISGTSGRGQLLKHAKIIFWDECTMAHKKSLEAMDRTLQELRKNSEIMGGALLILSGDFRQTLPVIPKSTPADEINACLKKSHLWPKVQILQLTKNMRVELSKDETAAHFAKILLQIGEGTYPTDQTTGLIELNSDFCNIATTENELIDKIYPNIIQNYTNVEWLFQRAILATKNNIVDDINFNILKKIPGEEKVYKSIDTMVSIEKSVNFPTEFLNSLQVPGMPLHCLRLKIGSPIILLRNLNSPKLCNGTRMIVKQLSNNVIEAELISERTKDTQYLYLEYH
ncbi:ATP-dependent DNA helicase PIF1 [Eumeta japonica]|uniref:ATP-dependent DNA helicase n=1 Tax=Eumeta variegata TaxID=151549 RepID=A0A4C1X303_EUMVA|nr:ATP-dependent DNA helicase PIF1 [Eumeta japonica]